MPHCQNACVCEEKNNMLVNQKVLALATSNVNLLDLIYVDLL